MFLNSQRPPQPQELVPILLHKPLVELGLSEPLRAVVQVTAFQRSRSMLMDGVVTAGVSAREECCEEEAEDGFERHFCGSQRWASAWVLSGSSRWLGGNGIWGEAV